MIDHRDWEDSHQIFTKITTFVNGVVCLWVHNFDFQLSLTFKKHIKNSSFMTHV